MLRNKKERKPSTVPEEPTQNRKASIFTDILTRNRKASAVPSETAQNPKIYTVPEGSPRTRKGSTFTDLLSRNRKASSVQENGIPKSTSSLRKPSIIMEEVRCKPKKILWRFCEGNFKHTDGDNVFYFFYSQTIWLKCPSLPPCKLWRRTVTSWSEKGPPWTGRWRLSKNSTSLWDMPLSGVTLGNRSSALKTTYTHVFFFFTLY